MWRTRLGMVVSIGNVDDDGGIYVCVLLLLSFLCGL